TGRVTDLITMVHNKVEELQVVKDITLVDAAGNPLKDASGAPIVKHIADCDAMTSTLARDGCQNLFFNVKACRGKTNQKTCEHKATAAWVVNNLNGGTDDGKTPIIVVTEVSLLDGNGDPLKDKAGNQRVRKLADCDTVTDKDSCRELFIAASNCKISPPDD